jgi:glycosyltransferase involved in cell wall biosynthesis
VLLIPSVYEGLPMVLCEAMLSGCFVIASSVCDHPKILGDNERGLLCDPLSPKSICKSLEKLDSMDFEKKSIITKRAREYAVKNFDINEMLDKYEALLISNKLS